MNEEILHISEDQEAQDFLNSLSSTPKTEVIIPDEISEHWLKGKAKKTFEENERIITKSNKLLIDKLEEWDEVSIKDIIQMKAEAFKNNQSLLGKDDEAVDTRKLIPSTINIQIINN